MTDASAIDRIVRNSQIIAQARPPSEEVLEVLRERGMAIFRAPEGKSFVIGDVPIGRAIIGNDRINAVTFFPVAADVAVGILDRRRGVQVEVMSRDQTRLMNAAIAAQSTMLAANNRALLVSLAGSVAYRGIELLVDQAAQNLGEAGE